MVIRPAVEADLDAIVSLMGDVQAVHAEAHPDLFRPRPDPDTSREMFRNALASEHQTLLVAEGPDGALLGYLWFQVYDRPENPAQPARRFGYVNHVGVAPDARRSGIGSALVREAMALAVGAGVAEIGLDYWAFNAGAARFFEVLGFAPRNITAFAPLDAASDATP